MSEQKTNVVRRLFEEVWNSRRVESLDQLLTSDSRNYDPNSPDTGSGPEAYKKVFSLYATAFPDLRLTINDLIEAGDKAVARWSAKGTHKGDLSGIPPTNKTIEITGTTTFRLVGGKIAEQWVNWNALGLMQQLGVVPETVKSTKAA